MPFERPNFEQGLWRKQRCCSLEKFYITQLMSWSEEAREGLTACPAVLLAFYLWSAFLESIRGFLTKFLFTNIWSFFFLAQKAPFPHHSCPSSWRRAHSVRCHKCRPGRSWMRIFNSAVKYQHGTGELWPRPVTFEQSGQLQTNLWRTALPILWVPRGCNRYNWVRYWSGGLKEIPHGFPINSVQAHWGASWSAE